MNRGAAIAAAFALDLVAGDPRGLPHPVRAIGSGIATGERVARAVSGNDAVAETLAGGVLTGAIVAAAAGYAACVVSLARRVRFGPRGARRARAVRSGALEVVLAASTLATRDLLAEADAVLDALERGDLALARRRLARIVGRDTDALAESEIVRAVIETLAESTCDGIVAPLCALAMGGVPFAFALKAASTLDSMIGHIEAPYTYFGTAAAKLDDALCFIPARLCAFAFCVLSPLVGGSVAQARNTWFADGTKHRSPNAGHPEAAMAGALRVRLGGTNEYGGVPHDGEILGAQFDVPVLADARRARTLVLWVATVLASTIAIFSAASDSGA